MPTLVQTGPDQYQISYLKHSDEKEEGIKTGSLLTYINPKRGSGGIFHDSKVLLYEFQRGKSTKGVIINKLERGKRIGGPVETNTKKIILHNIPDIKGSKKVIDGVFWYEGPMSELRPYLKKDEKYQINEYYGFSSWFEG